MTFAEWFNGFKTIINGIVNAFGRAFQLMLSDLRIFGVPIGVYFIFIVFVLVLFGTVVKD